MKGKRGASPESPNLLASFSGSTPKTSLPLDFLSDPERTYDGNEAPRPVLRVVLEPEVERLCEVWAEVARAILMRRNGRAS